MDCNGIILPFTISVLITSKNVKMGYFRGKHGAVRYRGVLMASRWSAEVGDLRGNT